MLTQALVTHARTHADTHTHMHTHTHTHTHACTPTHPFYGPADFVWDYLGEPVPAPICILLKQETDSGSGISWAICKSAPRPRQITMPTSHHSVFTGRMPFLPPNQQCRSTEGRQYSTQPVI